MGVEDSRFASLQNGERMDHLFRKHNSLRLICSFLASCKSLHSSHGNLNSNSKISRKVELIFLQTYFCISAAKILSSFLSITAARILPHAAEPCIHAVLHEGLCLACCVSFQRKRPITLEKA